jgi:hypothetical protein
MLLVKLGIIAAVIAIPTWTIFGIVIWPRLKRRNHT